jgi:hypothetical protein
MSDARQTHASDAPPMSDAPPPPPQAQASPPEAAPKGQGASNDSDLLISGGSTKRKSAVFAGGSQPGSKLPEQHHTSKDAGQLISSGKVRAMQDSMRKIHDATAQEAAADAGTAAPGKPGIQLEGMAGRTNVGDIRKMFTGSSKIETAETVLKRERQVQSAGREYNAVPAAALPEGGAAPSEHGAGDGAGANAIARRIADLADFPVTASGADEQRGDGAAAAAGAGHSRSAGLASGSEYTRALNR